MTPLRAVVRALPLAIVTLAACGGQQAAVEQSRQLDRDRYAADNAWVEGPSHVGETALPIVSRGGDLLRCYRAEFAEPEFAQSVIEVDLQFTREGWTVLTRSGQINTSVSFRDCMVQTVQSWDLKLDPVGDEALIPLAFGRLAPF